MLLSMKFVTIYAHSVSTANESESIFLRESEYFLCGVNLAIVVLSGSKQ